VDTRELYRRMAFNILTGNTDDHLKNHGFLMSDRQRELYRLSPAFDVLPHLNSIGNQAIGCGTLGRTATRLNALTAADGFNLHLDEAAQIFDEVREVVSNWRSYMQAHDVSILDINTIAPCYSVIEQIEAVD
jgi:serine/threonine-protein kinase HipA